MVEQVTELRNEQDGSEASEDEEDDFTTSVPVTEEIRVLAIARVNALDKRRFDRTKP